MKLVIILYLAIAITTSNGQTQQTRYSVGSNSGNRQGSYSNRPSSGNIQNFHGIPHNNYQGTGNKRNYYGNTDGLGLIFDAGYNLFGGGYNRGVVAPKASCRRWCEIPLQSPYAPKQYHCCESAYQPEQAVGPEKPGFCPTLRHQCNRFLAQASNAPYTCSNDGACAHTDKCCYDACIQKHICKPAQY